MALKDWKRIKPRGQAYAMWVNLHKLETITLYPPHISLSGKIWVVRIPSHTRYALGYTYDFKTKQEALKFIKDYMIRHSR